MCIEEYVTERICKLCEKHNMTKYRLAQLTGISQTALSNILNRESVPTIFTIDKICDAFGISVAQFFAEEDGYPNLTKEQKQLLEIWDGLDEKEREVFMAMSLGLKK